MPKTDNRQNSPDLKRRQSPPLCFANSNQGLEQVVCNMQVDLGMLGTVAGTVTCVCDFGRPEVAAACSFAAMVGGNMDCVRDITCKMIDQV